MTAQRLSEGGGPGTLWPGTSWWGAGWWGGGSACPWVTLANRLLSDSTLCGWGLQKAQLWSGDATLFFFIWVILVYNSI